MQSMTPETAMKVLHEVAAKMNGTLSDHQTVQSALQVIQGELDKAQNPKGKKEKVADSNGVDDTAK